MEGVDDVVVEGIDGEIEDEIDEGAEVPVGGRRRRGRRGDRRGERRDVSGIGVSGGAGGAVGGPEGIVVGSGEALPGSG